MVHKNSSRRQINQSLQLVENNNYTRGQVENMIITVIEKQRERRNRETRYDAKRLYCKEDTDSS